MKTAMYCRVIKHKIVLIEKRPLVKYKRDIEIMSVTVSDEVGCFIVNDSSVHRPTPRTGC